MSSSNIVLSIHRHTLSGTIKLTGSKSQSNRALIMQALSCGKIKIENLSEALDTTALQQILHSKGITLDVGPAGTAMRFLTAYYTLQQGEVILTGSNRMKQRPIGILVDALNQIGAHISYQENKGYPPLQIKGPLKQVSYQVLIRGDISSQYISALLLIAPQLPMGLELKIEGELTSRPYVEMTLAMLEQAGIKHVWNKSTIRISHQDFNTCTIYVEPDWSAASYWYSIAALADEAEFFLPGLNSYSLQGDRKIVEIMAHFGVTSRFQNGGVFLKKESKTSVCKQFDFKECPDLAQTVIVCCAALGHDATFTGLETLKIKETDRIQALQNELAKLGVKLIENHQVYQLDCSALHFPSRLIINTYDDHRMAMAFAPLALMIKEIEIEDAQVVIKSYPHFWDDLMHITN
ncbi:MAG: 3-phosphoshikimate 1-carboxyvinyltransferase [Sphingobacteriaceae bacterium]